MREYSPAAAAVANSVLFCRVPMSTRVPALILVAALAAACGGGSSGPTDPGGTPTPTPGSPVSGFVFYDENANGILDPTETVRLPSVGVTVGGVAASTAAEGRFSVPSVPNGSQTAEARPDTLPAYFTPGPMLSVSVPPSGDVAVPAVLALGTRAKPNVYLAFGDSITWGQGSSDGSGYSDVLQADLRAFWGKAGVAKDGEPGTKSNKGESRLGPSLSTHRPAYLLILYGTNDWNEPDCRNEFPCFTITALRSMVLQARDAGAFPVVGTIPPVNPAYVDRNPEERNDWVRRMNDLVRAMAKEERAAVAEVHGEFLKQSSLPALFDDDKHPNDAGFQLIARAFFGAITRPISASASRRAPAFFFRRPGRP
jgi:lysophospholipase L1-like esterase